jgi:hypothetical protein
MSKVKNIENGINVIQMHIIQMHLHDANTIQLDRMDKIKTVF